MKEYLINNGFTCYLYEGDKYWSKSELNYPFVKTNGGA
jgi:hypothetical protein